MANGYLSKDLTLEEFRRFRDLVQRQYGIYFEESKLDSLRISLVARATRLGHRSFSDYYAQLERDEAEFNELLNLVTVNETSFFRFPAQFDVLRDEILPEIASGKGRATRAVRIWSAGCSTGEEPYSIAMTVVDSGIEALGWRSQVLGTDVSTKALATAKAGVYHRRSMGNLSPELIARHFDLIDVERFRVKEGIRSRVDFGYHNLIREPYPLSLMGNWDVIFCRNVTIYFRPESTKRVLENLYHSLNEGGYLFLGHSETLSEAETPFEAVEVGGVYVYRRPRTRRRFGLGPHRSAPVVREAAPAASAAGPASGRSQGQQRKVRRASAAAETLAAARAELEAGRAEAALSLVARALASAPNDADAHLLAAYIYADTGAYDDALDSCHRALAINPLLPVARYILGIIYQRQGDTVRAVSEFKKTVYVDDAFALAHLNLANIYKSQRKWEAAAREYERAIEVVRSSPQGPWVAFAGGFQPDLLISTCERSLAECRKAMSGGA